jgi:hypothetical protein
MATKVYGASDDLIEIEGDYRGEASHYSDDESALLVMSDGTLLSALYGERGIWEIKLVRKGTLLDRIDQCDDEDADPHSDVAHFKDGIKWAYVAKEWSKVE